MRTRQFNHQETQLPTSTTTSAAMKCRSPTTQLRIYWPANVSIVLKVGRVAIITRGRYAGKKVGLLFNVFPFFCVRDLCEMCRRRLHRCPRGSASYDTSLGFCGIIKKSYLPILRSGCHHPTPGHRFQDTPFPSCPRRRHRTIPFTNHTPHVKSSSVEALKGQAVH